MSYFYCEKMSFYLKDALFYVIDYEPETQPNIPDFIGWHWKH